MITPAISVLSAVEGIGIMTPVLGSYVIPLTIAILIGLFLIQRHGPARVGSLFGPVILVWLCFLAVTGALQVAHTPQVLSAIFPWHAVRFLILNKLHGFVVLGAVFLVVTGTEALYADMGHFGTRPIRLTWFTLVFPALVLNYFGQGAVLLVSPGATHHPFYAMVPSWAMAPTVLLATLSTIIASQAVISGAVFLDSASHSAGVSAPFGCAAYFRKSNRPDLYRSGQLGAHGLHGRFGGRFSILQPACRGIRSGSHIHDAHDHDTVLRGGSQTMALASEMGRGVVRPLPGG